MFFFAGNAVAATFVVSNVNDSGPGSLRQAINEANVNGQPDTITFDPSVFSSQQTITLTTGALSIEKDSHGTELPHELTITGPGANLLTVDGSGRSRVFSIERLARAIISGLTISGGNAANEAYYRGVGGGIVVHGGFIGELDSLILRDSRVRNNEASIGGGILIAGRSTIVNTVIDENRAVQGSGGGVYVSISSVLNIVNTSFSRNTALSGAALYGFEHSRSYLTNCTVVQNTSSGWGGAIGQQYNGTTTLRNSIVAQNIGQGPADLTGPIVSAGRNLIGQAEADPYVVGEAEGDMINVDPLIRLAVEGEADPDLEPLAGSPAIDRGDPCVLVPLSEGGCLNEAIESDIRGVLRPQDGDSDGTPAVDIGAWELPGGGEQVPTPNIPDLLDAYDTGISNADNITTARDLSFRVDGIRTGATVEVYRNETLIVDEVANDSFLNFSDNALPANAELIYRVRQIVDSVPSTSRTLRVVIDNTAPTITIGRHPLQPDLAWTQPIRYRATLSEIVTGLEPGDVSFTGSTIGVSAATVVFGASRPTFDIEVSGLSGSGRLSISIPMDRFRDLAGNLSAPSLADAIMIGETAGADEAPRFDHTFVSGTGFDYPVLKLARQPDGKIIAVGQFLTSLGLASKKIVRLRPDGNVDTTFNAGTGADRDIHSIILQPDGKIIVVGEFTTFDGKPAGRIARLDPDGSLDESFNTGTGFSSGVAYDVGLQSDGKIIVGGSFLYFNEHRVKILVRLDRHGGIDDTFQAAEDWFSGGVVRSVRIQPDDRVLAAGDFVSGLRRLHPDGTTDTSFTMAVTKGFVSHIEVKGEHIYIGGRIGLNRLFWNGSIDHDFNVFGLQYIKHFTVRDDGKVLVAGKLYTENGNDMLFRLEPNGVQDESFSRTELSPINWVLLGSNNSVLVGGHFFQPHSGGSSQYRAGVRKFGPDGILDGSFAVKLGAIEGGADKILFQSDGKIIVVGGFTSVGIIDRPSMARLNVDGSLDESFYPGVSGIASAAIQPDGKIIVGGYRYTVQGTHPLHRLHSDGSIDPTFTASIASSGGASLNLSDIAIQADGKILAVGGFESVNGTDRRAIVRLDASGNIDPTFQLDSQLDAVSINRVRLSPEGKILIAGRFTTGHFVCRLSSSGSLEAVTPLGLPYSWVEHPVRDMALQQDGKLLIAGYFSQAGGTGASRIARINPDGSVDTQFRSPGMSISESAVTVLPLSNGKILVGGTFLDLDGTGISRFARLYPDGTVDTSFQMNFQFGGSVDRITQQADGKIVFGGGFTRINDVVRFGISRLMPLSATVEYRTITGRVVDPAGRGLRAATVTLIDPRGERRTTTTSSFGYFQFEGVASGPYTLAASSKRYRFATRQVNVDGDKDLADMKGVE